MFSNKEWMHRGYKMLCSEKGGAGTRFYAKGTPLVLAYAKQCVICLFTELAIIYVISLKCQYKRRHNKDATFTSGTLNQKTGYD